MRKNIVLIGFMATGKTTIGKQVAAQLNYEFIDTDQLIEIQEGMDIPEIFRRYGEPYFRHLESKVARQLAEVDHKVISTGGGFPLNPDNLSVFRPDSLIVLLTAEPEVIFQRVQGQTGRPLLNDPDPLGRIKKLLAEREAFYRKADVTVDTGAGTPEEVSRKIIDYWRKRRRGDGAGYA